MNKVVITLQAEDLLELQQVVIDDDQKAALEFLKTRIVLMTTKVMEPWLARLSVSQTPHLKYMSVIGVYFVRNHPAGVSAHLNCINFNSFCT